MDNIDGSSSEFLSKLAQDVRDADADAEHGEDADIRRDIEEYHRITKLMTPEKQNSFDNDGLIPERLQRSLYDLDLDKVYTASDLEDPAVLKTAVRLLFRKAQGQDVKEARPTAHINYSHLDFGKNKQRSKRGTSSEMPTSVKPRP